MSELHVALKHLGPVSWDDVPKDALHTYMAEILSAGELICNSLPALADGTPFHASKTHHNEHNSAKSHKDIFPSVARSHPPHEEHTALAKGWGKPMKFNASTNPLKVAVYKMAGKDRHGAWFARQSVHEGLGFDKFKRAMMREFAESMTVEGGPGAGAVRGIAADRRLERIDVPGLGKLEVYELSAQFPGPVTPRDFLTMLLSSDTSLSEKSAAEVEGGKKHVPRHFMIVSKPVEHPDAPERSGFVRGHYESVEMIREIPLSTKKSKSDTQLLRSKVADTKANGDQDAANRDTQGSFEPELNPVEWTMVTRSDPGGGIPRFLVDRGTPETMLQDVHKFFDWACALDEIPHPDEDLEQQKQVSTGQAENGSVAPSKMDGKAPTITSGGTDEQTPRQSVHDITRNRAAAEPAPAQGQASSQGGLVSSLTGYLEAGIDAYAPTSVSNMLHSRLHPESSSSELSDASSIDSFMSAEELRRISTAPETAGPHESTDVLSLASGNQSQESLSTKCMTHHEKEVHKLSKKRERLDQTLAKKRLEQEQKIREAQDKDKSEADKAREKAEKELKKTEEKHRREMERLEAKKDREAKKVMEKRKKKEEQNKLSLVSRERDDFRSQVDLYRRENTLLRDQVADLQRQNTLLAQKLGPDALKSLEDDMGRKRSESVRSAGSGSSETVKKKT